MLLATADPTNGIAKDGPGATGSKASKADERASVATALLMQCRHDTFAVHFRR